MRHIVGLDIGGANLKAAHSDGACRSMAFPVWKEPDRLTRVLAELIHDWLPCRALAVTMTAELADCFETKAAGVDFILEAVELVATQTTETIPVVVWQTSGEFVTTDVAREFPQLTAAANWHALSTFAGRMTEDSTAILIDTGSTTTDIIPLVNGMPDPTGRTDGERLISGELVYCGVRRTPLCALAWSVPVGDKYSQLAAELFATTLDVYLLTGDINENPQDHETANGRPATRAAAHDRIARMLCSDRTEIDLATACDVAGFLADIQRQRIAGALNRVLVTLEKPCSCVLISGSGSFLAERIVQEHNRLKHVPILRLADTFNASTAESACAFAVARLAFERE